MTVDTGMYNACVVHMQRHVGNYSIKELVVAMLGVPSAGREVGGGPGGGGLGLFMDRDISKPLLPVTFIQEQRVFTMLVATLSNPAAGEESHVQVSLQSS